MSCKLVVEGKNYLFCNSIRLCNVIALLFTVIKARNIAALDPNGKSDPYCVVTVDGPVEQQQKTEIMNATLEPEWNKSFEFSVTPPHRWNPDDRKAGSAISHYVKVDMWDYDRLNRDDFLGTIMLPLVEVTTNADPAWYMLSRSNSKQIVKGEIKLKVYFKTSQVSCSVCKHAQMYMYSIKMV